MKRTPGKVLVAQMMAEKVNYSGELIARGALAVRMQKEGHDPRAVDYFAFGTRAVSNEDSEAFCAVCVCGARWLGTMPVELQTCPTCEKRDA